MTNEEKLTEARKLLDLSASDLKMASEVHRQLEAVVLQSNKDLEERKSVNRELADNYYYARLSLAMERNQGTTNAEEGVLFETISGYGADSNGAILEVILETNKNMASTLEEVLARGSLATEDDREGVRLLLVNLRSQPAELDRICNGYLYNIRSAHRIAKATS